MDQNNYLTIEENFEIIKNKLDVIIEFQNDLIKKMKGEN